VIYASLMSPVAEPPVEPVVERARGRVIAQLLAWRARAIPMFSAVALLVVLVDPRPWRVLILGLAAATLAVISFVELRAFSGVPLTLARVRVNLVVSGLCQLGLVVCSGGLASPIAPAVLIVALMFNLTAPPRLAGAFVLLVHVPAVWLLALAHTYDLVPGLVPFGALAPVLVGTTGPALAALAYTLFFVGAVILGQRIRRTLDSAIDERVAEQHRLLALHEETARTMSALSSEIAHELKNPLASVKGLAGLLRRDVDGAAKERLEVMRAEIDRMQGILEELLNYSRPVVPLELRPLAVREVLVEVRTLHEGMALSRDVSLAPLASTDVVVACDVRKVRQILVNVLQNAIEASPQGGTVAIALRHEGTSAIIDVDDDGAGLDPSVRGALFEVGATTKPKGSGIGLAIARGLARQHGGELTLENRPGRAGCRARLTLPLAGPSVEASPKAEPGQSSSSALVVAPIPSPRAPTGAAGAVA